MAIIPPTGIVQLVLAISSETMCHSMHSKIVRNCIFKDTMISYKIYSTESISHTVQYIIKFMHVTPINVTASIKFVNVKWQQQLQNTIKLHPNLSLVLCDMIIKYLHVIMDYNPLLMVLEYIGFFYRNLLIQLRHQKLFCSNSK